MKSAMPKSFYFKLSFIIVVLLWLYVQNATMISEILVRDDLTSTQRATAIFQQLMGVQNAQRQPTVENVPIPSYDMPRVLDETITTLPLYQKASEAATQFNQNVDMVILNSDFTNKINMLREQEGLSEIAYADYLLDGVRARTAELGNFHYLGGQTVSGETFRSFFPDVSEAEYRLSEQLYEMYISADDIHLKTWENESILVDYLLKAYGATILEDSYANQAVYIYASPTDYQVETVAYVRIVVARVTDNR